MATDKLPACRKCAYWDRPYVPSEGSQDAEVFLLADSPWRTEIQRRRPMIGPAGEILNALLETYGFDRRDVYIANAVRCQPEQLGQAHPAGVTDLCTTLYLKRELERINPKLVVPMGNVALKALGAKENISRARGLVKDIEFKGGTYKILPTFHPSHILRTPAYLPYMEQDFQAIQYFLEHGHQQPHNADVDYHPVTTKQELASFFKEFDKAKYIAWDTETTGLDYRTDEILSMSFSFASHTGYCLPFFKLPYKDNNGAHFPTIFNDALVTKLLYLLERQDKVFFFHNGKFDLRMMHYFFWRHFRMYFNIDRIRWHDTMAMYGLLNENTSQSLKEIAKIHTDLRYTSEEMSKVKNGQMKTVPLDKMAAYSVKDTDATRRLAMKFGKELRRDDLWDIYCQHDASDMKIANILYKMEVFGAPIDLTELQKLEQFMQKKLFHYHKRMEWVVGKPFNPNSDPQLRTVLFDDLKFPIPEKRTPGGQISTDKEVVSGLMEQFPNHQFLKNFRMHRNYTSIEETFVRGFEKRMGADGRLHPDFGFTRTVSGRVVCYQPNLANIPREKEFEEGIFVSIRSLFAAKPGKKIIYADFSQQEFKVMALLSGDKRLIKALFVDYEDFHSLVARALYRRYAETEVLLKKYQEQLCDSALSPKLREDIEIRMQSCSILLKDGRTKAKNFNFGRNYLATLPTLARTLNITEHEVEMYIERLARRYPDFEAFIHDTPIEAVREGELHNRYGRLRRFPPTPDSRVEEAQGRQAGNFGPQSNSAYMGRAALVRIATAFERVGMNAYPFNVVYDSILTEAPDDEVTDASEIIIKQMIAPVPELWNYSFGIEWGVGQNWQQSEKNATKIYTMEDFHALALKGK